MAVPAEGSSWVSDHIKLTGEPCGSGLSKDLPVQSRILVIESDAALAFLLKTTLEMQGYVVDTVSTSQDALGLMDLHAVHLVLMDALINDEETGWELCRVLKARCAALRIVFTSTVHNREKALDAGADLYLPKPFELVTLFLWIERLLKH
jgi:DNA-binding response OmpR family regulator